MSSVWFVASTTLHPMATSWDYRMCMLLCVCGIASLTTCGYACFLRNCPVGGKRSVIELVRRGTIGRSDWTYDLEPHAVSHSYICHLNSRLMMRCCRSSATAVLPACDTLRPAFCDRMRLFVRRLQCLIKNSQVEPPKLCHYAVVSRTLCILHFGAVAHYLVLWAMCCSNIRNGKFDPLPNENYYRPLRTKLAQSIPSLVT
jgi:hypothetical protein